MFKKNLLILIPAKSRSTSIKNKNLVKLFNKPLIYYTINFAKKIKIKDKLIFCSTDSKKIKKIADQYGLDTPFLRPKKYCKDTSRDVEVVNHTLIQFYKKKITFNYGLLLRPTSPLRKHNDIIKAFSILKRNKKATSIRAVIKSKNNPFKTWTIGKNFLKPILKSKIKEHYNAPRQILPKTYWQTGNFEFFKIKYKNKIKSISGKNILPYIVDPNIVLDIDEYKDLKNLKKNLLN